MAKVTLENVSKHFVSKHSTEVIAVKDFSLEIEDKEFVVFVGPSGCGKTTTLRMIAGLEEITQGNIYIGDRLVNRMPAKDRDIAMVFQNYALYPHMTVYDNLAFSLEMRKLSKQDIRGSEKLQKSSTSQNSFKGNPRPYPGGRGRGWPLEEPLCESLKSSSLMSPYPISTPNSESRCEVS
jgi:multiple sugar transport system ATP-binding protein